MTNPPQNEMPPDVVDDDFWDVYVVRLTDPDGNVQDEIETIWAMNRQDAQDGALDELGDGWQVEILGRL